MPYTLNHLTPICVKATIFYLIFCIGTFLFDFFGPVPNVAPVKAIGPVQPFNVTLSFRVSPEMTSHEWVNLLVVPLTFVLILNAIWMYRAMFNARWLEPRHLKYSPALNVAFLFFPLTNLWAPLERMRQTWWASHRDALDASAMVPPFIKTMHLAWLAHVFLGYSAIYIKATPDEKRIQAMWQDALSLPPLLIATILFIRYIRKISEAQTSRNSAPGYRAQGR